MTDKLPPLPEPKDLYYDPNELLAWGADIRRLALEEAANEWADALRAEIEHCAMNEMRMPPHFGQSEGQPAMPTAYVEAVIERFTVNQPLK